MARLCYDIPVPPQRLTRSFYRRPAEIVARSLLGKLLVHRGRAGFIVETEAYLGAQDKASHARFGPTDRNAVMFGDGGFSYVYLCYGMHHMFNIVTGPAGSAAAVLVRALEPHAGLGDAAATARGPGKLCRALAVTRAHSGIDLTVDEHLLVADARRRIRPEQIAVGPRVGVEYAAEWARAPLRYWIAGHPSVSKSPKRQAKAG